MKKNHLFTLIIFLIGLPLSGIAESEIFQAGTMLNLMDGVYDGSTPFSQLDTRGDMGLGTGNGLSGELI